MTREAFLKMCAFGFLHILHPLQKGKVSVDNAQPLDVIWNQAWIDIDMVFVDLVKQASTSIKNLYVEKGNFTTRDCPINAYLVLANPICGNVAQMESSDMVSIDVTFCIEKTDFSVVTIVSKGEIIAHLEQGPISLNQSYQEIREELQPVLANISSLIGQSTQAIQELLV